MEEREERSSPAEPEYDGESCPLCGGKPRVFLVPVPVRSVAHHRHESAASDFFVAILIALITVSAVKLYRSL